MKKSYPEMRRLVHTFSFLARLASFPVFLVFTNFINAQGLPEGLEECYTITSTCFEIDVTYFNEGRSDIYAYFAEDFVTGITVVNNGLENWVSNVNVSGSGMPTSSAASGPYPKYSPERFRNRFMVAP